MADNVEITAGSGTSIAADDISSVWYQRVKIALGADGAHDMDWDSGQQTMANSAPVAIASNQSAISIKDTGATWTTVRGVSGAAVVSADATSATAVTDAPTGGQKIVITDIIYSSDTAMNLLFEEETSGTDVFKVFVPAYGSGQITPRSACKLATADKKLTVKASVAGNVAVTVFYYSEA